MDVGPFLPGHYTGCPTIWLRDMGGDPPHWDSPGGGSATGWYGRLRGSNHINELSSGSTGTKALSSLVLIYIY